ncbi:MAG TPA: alpha/beta fold hydrolase [Ktedonobacterales bacterium]|nr:alpha/beta fold hydrolase [Ktedonobacterales bacterium]
MATQITYRPDHAGDWGEPAPATGGRYDTGTLTLPDGVPLFFRTWLAPDTQAPVLYILHGLGAHTGWFIDMGNALNARGLSVYADDHRGFGRSGGPRGHVRRGGVYLDDAERVVDEIQKRHPGAPVFVLGHSMGGIFAVHLAANDAASGRNRLAGLILLNPWIRDTANVSPRELAGILAGGALGLEQPRRMAEGPEFMTTNPQADQMVKADTYWVRSESASFLFQITLLRTAVKKKARRVRVPALVLQSGQDRSVVPEASRACYEWLAATDKTWKTYPEYAHDAEFEGDRSAMDDDIADWILRHSTRGSR